MNINVTKLSKEADKTQKIKDKIKLLTPSEATDLIRYIDRITSRNK